MDSVKNTLDILDEHHMKDVWMHEGVVFSGDITLINDQTHEKKQIPTLLGAAVLGLNNTATPSTSTTKHDLIWTDIDAQEMYLNAKPTCYIIFGKAGLGAYSLGEAVAKKYNCIHLCPKNIINDELSQGSTTGKCLEFNMRHNNVCTYTTILPMLKQKVKSAAVQHRGYVISGIPLATSTIVPYYLIKSNHCEEALYNADETLFDVINNLKRKKPKQPNAGTSDEFGNADNMGEEEYNVEEEEEVQKEEELVEEGAEEEETVAELPKLVLDPCSNVFFNTKPFYETRQAILLAQLHEVFNLDLQPDVIIYMTCPDPDVVTKINHKYINYKNGQHTVEPFVTKVESELRWPIQYVISDYENPPTNIVFNPKYNCRPPIYFKEEAVNQLCNYRNYILPYIEKKIMDYDPKKVIKLDGRTSTYQMMHQITERLLLMDVKPVLIPEPLHLPEPPEDLEEFWNIVQESQVIRCNDILSFKQYASPWYNRCPVELRNRQSVIGKPKYAVKIFKHVYLMSSLNNFITFCRNPRPFLKLQYLEPTCRIIITGTKSSGKTMTAECLSWIFDAPVISFDKILNIETHKKYDMYARRIYSEILPVLEDARYTEWQTKEQNREASLNLWNQSTLKNLKIYLPLLVENLKYLKEEEEKQQYNDLKDGKKVLEEESEVPEFLEKYNTIRKRISYLPILDSVEQCQIVITSKNLSQYVPSELITPTVKPTLPLLGDEDVTKAITEYIAANELQKEILPTVEEIMNVIIKFIKDIDSERQILSNFREFYGKYIIDGFPLEGEYWDILSNAKLIPDYTIAIMENREIDPDLLTHYLGIDKHIKNHHEILLSANDPLILCKLQTKKISISKSKDIEIIVHDMINDLLSNLTDAAVDSTNIETTPAISPEMIASFTESIEKFREDWDNIKIRLEEKAKCFIEIELENKTNVEVLEQVLLQIRQGYFLTSNVDESGEIEDEENPESSKDVLTYNNPENLCETSIYCPYTYFNYGLVWEGKREFCLKYDNKVHYFAKEEFLELFRRDITKYQAYNSPFKKIPKLKVCIIGCSGSGLTAISKRIAMELGLIHIHFADIINYFYMPRHYKMVGRKYENPFIDEPMEEEGVVEFQMDEENPNLLADIVSNEKELRRIVYNYYERGQPILPMIMHKIIKKLWFTAPFNNTGFVLDGYPRLPQDVEDLVYCNCIPDIVIEIEGNADIGVQRIGPLMFKQWKSQLKEAKEAHKTVIETQQKIWISLITKMAVIELIIEEVIENCVGKEVPPLKKESLSVDSFVFDAHPTGSTNVDPKLFQIYNELVEKYPQPQDTREWEKPEDVRERINARIEAICEMECENIQALKDILLDNKIKVVSVDGSKSFFKVLGRTLSALNPLRDRCLSFFEQTYIITTDIAELLLSKGYFLLSRFGRLCPVYTYDHPQSILNSYKISRRKGKLFPVIHRAFIYFLCSEENVIKFRENPLEYIICDNIKSYKPYTLKIGIIGAPKSGKSTLATKLAKRNNLLPISKGMALRKVLETMQWTELGCRIMKRLDNGDIITPDCVMDAVQTVAIDHRTVTYGFVLDGIPSSPYEAITLSQNGLYPNIIFDISSDKAVILENCQNEVYNDIIKYMPPYSYSLMEFKFAKWNEQSYKIRSWVNNDYQNLCSIDGNRSKWQCLQDINEIIKQLMSEIYSYLAKSATDVVPAKVMAISNEVFQERMSSFKDLCPVCLRKNTLRHSGHPVDKKGVVQYKNQLYWACSEHFNLIMKFPDYYLDDDSIDIPELPAMVNFIHPDNVYENGICIVTYAENLPDQYLERGTHEYAAAYKSKTYLFCSEACLNKFLEKPDLFSDITIFKGSSWYPRLSLKKLPDLGYLEQTLANILTAACCSVIAVRPKHPGLSIELSALLHIALYLKIHNPRFPKDQIEYFQKALKMYENRCKLILDIGLRMRSMENPFITYPKCHHGTPKQCSSETNSSMGSKPSHSGSNQFEQFVNYDPTVESVKDFLNPNLPNRSPIGSGDDTTFSKYYS